MGKRGPKPMSRGQLAARGSWLAKHRADSAGQFDGQAVPTPAGMDDIAGATFQAVQSRLISLGVWDSVFAGPLERYAECWSLWIKLVNNPVTLPGDLARLNVLLCNLEKVFFLNPADRKNLPGQESKPDDDKMRFFKPKLTS